MSALLEISSANQTVTPAKATTLVFIDAGVEDYQFLANGVVREAKAFILDSQRDGVKQISQILQDYPDVESIHLVSHGSPGSIQLGNTYLSLDTLDRYRSKLQSWLAKAKSLLIYGCNVAAEDAGEELIDKLHRLTGANIAASTTKTGNSALGGDWNLEIATGNLKKADLVFNSQVTQEFPSVLAVNLPGFIQSTSSIAIVSTRRR